MRSLGLLLPLGALVLWAQVTASISGRVEDATGAGVGGATVTVKNLETGATRAVTTGDSGNFRVLCDGEHDEELTEAEEQAVEAIATQAIPVFSPGRSPFEEHDRAGARTQRTPSLFNY